MSGPQAGSGLAPGDAWAERPVSSRAIATQVWQCLRLHAGSREGSTEQQWRLSLGGGRPSSPHPAAAGRLSVSSRVPVSQSGRVSQQRGRGRALAEDRLRLLHLPHMAAASTVVTARGCGTLGWGARCGAGTPRSSGRGRGSAAKKALPILSHHTPLRDRAILYLHPSYWFEVTLFLPLVAGLLFSQTSGDSTCWVLCGVVARGGGPGVHLPRRHGGSPPPAHF